MVITYKFDWRGAYHYYQFPMSQYCSDDVADATPKSFEIGFDIASSTFGTAPNPNGTGGNVSTKLNVCVIVEYEKSYKMNRFTGEFVQ